MSVKDMEQKATAVINPAVAALERAMGSITAMLPQHLTAERMSRLSLGVLRTNKALNAAARDNPASFVNAVIASAKLGLEPGVDAHLIPFANKRTGKPEINFIPDYRGLMKLARQSGEVVTIQVHLVYSGDHFDMDLGIETRITHKPKLSGDRGELILAYAVAKFRDGSVQVEWMTKESIDGIRARSRSANSGPWVTDYEEMARKTVVRKLCKWLPRSLELVNAEKIMDAADQGKQAAFEGDVLVIDGESEEVPTEAPSDAG